MAASRASTFVQASSPSVVIRSNTERTSCSPLAITDTSDCGTRASAISTSRPSRSRNASLATCSRSSVGVAAVASASARRVRSARAANPSGERSVRASLVARQPEVGRGDRVEGGVLVDVPLGDRVDGAGGCVVVGHAEHPRPGRPQGSRRFPGPRPPGVFGGPNPAHPAYLAAGSASTRRVWRDFRRQSRRVSGVRAARVAGSAGEGAGAPAAGAGREGGGGRDRGPTTRGAASARGATWAAPSAATTATRAASSSSVGSPFTTRSSGAG